MHLKFFRIAKDVSEEAKYIDFTLLGIDGCWRVKLLQACASPGSNFQRMITTQITDT